MRDGENGPSVCYAEWDIRNVLRSGYEGWSVLGMDIWMYLPPPTSGLAVVGLQRG